MRIQVMKGYSIVALLLVSFSWGMFSTVQRELNSVACVIAAIVLIQAVQKKGRGRHAGYFAIPMFGLTPHPQLSAVDSTPGSQSL